MRDQLKNEFLLLMNTKVSSEDLKILNTKLDLILSNYEIAPRNTELIPYGSDIPKTVEIYIVSKKIEGLSEKSLYLYKIVLENFFQTIRKKPEQISETTALDLGMSVVDVSRLLGHQKLETTMEYITANSDSIKTNHQNFII